ncbi:type II CAAX prenyl endopeptidase Rce1 family protein [Halomicroarcula sp. GCM10025710]
MSPLRSRSRSLGRCPLRACARSHRTGNRGTSLAWHRSNRSRPWGGVTTGIIITAVIFTAKHALLDVSLVRVPTILVLALVLGIVRHRWGTTASTVVHMVVNLTSVGLLAIYVLG